jgi:hypothetical protein
MSETRILIRLLRIYFPRISGFGSVSGFRGGGFEPPNPQRYATVQEAGWAPGPVWTGAKNVADTGIRSPDRPARRQSLYRLSYRAH